MAKLSFRLELTNSIKGLKDQRQQQQVEFRNNTVFIAF